MHSARLLVPFQECRRRDAGTRLFMPLRVESVEYLLRFIDGAQEHYQVAYRASIEVEKIRGRWRYRGHASRQLSLYNKAGERFEQADTDRRLELLLDMDSDELDDWHRWHECKFNPDASLEEDAFEEIVQEHSRGFAASVVADKSRLVQRFRHMYKGVEAISEIA